MLLPVLTTNSKDFQVSTLSHKKRFHWAPKITPEFNRNSSTFPTEQSNVCHIPHMALADKTLTWLGVTCSTEQEAEIVNQLRRLLTKFVRSYSSSYCFSSHKSGSVSNTVFIVTVPDVTVWFLTVF